MKSTEITVRVHDIQKYKNHEIELFSDSFPEKFNYCTYSSFIKFNLMTSYSLL